MSFQNTRLRSACSLALCGALLTCSCGGTQRPDGGTGPLLRGNTVSALSATDQHGKTVRVGRDSSPFTVVYFYPKDGTPGCTAEACAFRDVWRQYEAAKIQVLGVSNDDRQSHRQFAKDEHLPFSLIADIDGTWAKTFGVSNFAGFYARVTFLVDQNGVVVKTYRDIDPGLHAKQILQDVHELQSQLRVPVHAPYVPTTDVLAPAPRPAPQLGSTVHLQLQSTDPVETVGGKREFWLAATLTPPPGSHLYWKHSGEVGLPTRVNFIGPEGLHVGVAQYPSPQRFTTQHGQVSYGYDGPVTVVAHVIGDLAKQEAGFQVFGSWLSCDVRCVKEQGTATLTYKDDSFTNPTLQAEPLLTRLCKPGGDVGLTFTFEAGQNLLHIDSRHSQQLEVLDVFAEQDFGPNDRVPERQSSGQGRTWTWRAGAAPSALTVYAVLNGQTACYELTR